MSALVFSVPLAPLFASIIAGLGGRYLTDRNAHRVAVGGAGWAFLASAIVAWQVIVGEADSLSIHGYTWAQFGEVDIGVGFLIDNLTAMMMLTVTFVSLMVHIYTIGYMEGDPGYRRFYSYIALFTFAMLVLVMADNFLQLFFGWEAVGLASYLLIGFWFKRPSAVHANLKAFLVNRVGDLGFLVGIGLIWAAFGTLDYADVFARSDELKTASLDALPPGWDAATVICLLLFVGAMGKSAQFPLHVWLPDSMEGPTPISALIHAATMVTAGIFMVARMSPLFELSEVALTTVLVIGTATAFFMGLLGLVQNDIKRVVAYSTLSQLGYMTAALGASAYSAAVFHLFTHAFFKALLFLGAGSVIIAMHHEQDMRKMGGLRRYMPITYWTAVAGSLALAGVPPFSGFFSKDAIIEAVGASSSPFADIAYWALLAGAFITALYTFRMLILTFHGTERMDGKLREHLHESPHVVTVPLILLAIPSVLIGGVLIDMLFGDFFAASIYVLPEHDTVAVVRDHAEGSALVMLQHGITAPALWAGLAGIGVAVWLYSGWPERTRMFSGNIIYNILQAKYGCDVFNEWFFARGARKLGGVLWRRMDAGVIDGFFVNGAAKTVAATARVVRHFQSGAIYHYAFLMLFAVALMLLWRLWPPQ